MNARSMDAKHPHVTSVLQRAVQLIPFELRATVPGGILAIADGSVELAAAVIQLTVDLVDLTGSVPRLLCTVGSGALRHSHPRCLSYKVGQPIALVLVSPAQAVGNDGPLLPSTRIGDDDVVLLDEEAAEDPCLLRATVAYATISELSMAVAAAERRRECVCGKGGGGGCMCHGS